MVNRQTTEDLYERRNAMATKHTPTVRYLAGVALLAGVAGTSISASAEEIFTMQVHPEEIPGTWEINHGKYDRAIPLLEIAIARAKRSARVQGPILTNLCVAYTKVGNYEAATRFCDQAVEWSFEVGIAHNNRGVLQALKHNYAAASEDFEAARRRPESVELATHNIERLGEQLSEFDGDSPPSDSSNSNV
jgi:Flp pilus assembly protein TadD